MGIIVVLYLKKDPVKFVAVTESHDFGYDERNKNGCYEVKAECENVYEIKLFLAYAQFHISRLRILKARWECVQN